MTLLVLDASVAASWYIESQATPAGDRLLREIASHEAIAPYVFGLETPWLLLRHQRRHALPGFAKAALLALDDHGIAVQPAPGRSGRAAAFDAAERLGIGLYDAMYVLLALETGAMLATRDGGMADAARRLGAETLDVRGEA